MLLAGLWVAVDYRINLSGSSLIDWLYARPVVLDVDTLTGGETERETAMNQRGQGRVVLRSAPAGKIRSRPL